MWRNPTGKRWNMNFDIIPMQIQLKQWPRIVQRPLHEATVLMHCERG